MHNYRSLIRKPRERRQCKHNARTKLPPAATKCKCTTTGHKCDTELQAETRCHDAVEPLPFPVLLHGMRNKNCHTSIYKYQDRLPKKTAPCQICPLLMHFNENITYIFFCGIHHIDPLHRKQTLTLSQCNSRDLTDSPYRKLEKCKKCYRYPFANRHLFHEHSAYI